MNEYKCLIVSNGMTMIIYVSAYDISAAAMATGYPIETIIKVELVDTTKSVADYRTN